jgi:hypothetical protein
MLPISSKYIAYISPYCYSKGNKNLKTVFLFLLSFFPIHNSSVTEFGKLLDGFTVCNGVTSRCRCTNIQRTSRLFSSLKPGKQFHQGSRPRIEPGTLQAGAITAELRQSHLFKSKRQILLNLIEFRSTLKLLIRPLETV